MDIFWKVLRNDNYCYVFRKFLSKEKSILRLREQGVFEDCISIYVHVQILITTCIFTQYTLFVSITDESTSHTW